MAENEVAVAFGIVLEEIENAIAALNQQGAESFQGSRYKAAKKLMEKGSQLTAFREKVHELQKECINIFATVTSGKVRKTSERNGGRLKRGLRTPENVFRIPILQTVVSLGGSASVRNIIDRVAVLMEAKLNDYDRQSLPSHPDQIRWRNTAMFARKDMVREGLLSSNSQFGIWEITPVGREWLAANAKQE